MMARLAGWDGTDVEVDLTGSYKTVSKPFADYGERVTYTIGIRSGTGPLAETALMTDTLPPGQVLVPGSFSASSGEGSMNYDLDMPPVVELRRKFFTETERYRMIAASVVDLAWMDTVASGGRPVLVVAEGLLMYLDEADVKRLVLGLHETFPGCQLVADVFSRMTARSATNHPSLKNTGASLGWGIDDPCELETWASGIRLLEEWYFTDDPDLAQLSIGYRMAYRLAGAFKIVQRAHRIVYYQL